MLGNDYDGNLKKLYDSKSKIKESYIGLEKTVKNTPNEKEKLDEVNKSLNNTIAFVDDGINKMESIKNIDRTPEVLSKLYQDYKKSATPLANANMETFSKLVKTKEAGLEKRTKELNFPYYPRLYGYLSEYLSNVYFYHNKLRIKEDSF